MKTIIVLSVALRLVSALYHGNSITPLPGTYDQVSYHALAGRVLDGHGFSFAKPWWPATRAGKPTAHWSYVYTLYLAVVYLLFGTNPIIARLIQAVVVGILHAWLAYRLGRRLFGETAGLAASAFVAIYGYFVYYSGALVTESFYIVAILWTLDAATGMAESGAAGKPIALRRWLLLGLAAGLAVLLRQVFLLFLPFLFVWLLYLLRHSDRRRNLAAGAAVACVAVALMIAPWTIRNYRAFGRFVPLNTNAGFAFFWGNHPIHGTHFIPILQEQGSSYGTLIPNRMHRLDEAAVDRELMKEGIGFVVQDPKRYALLSLSRTTEYFRFWPSGNSSFADNLLRFLSFGLFLPLMVIGIATSPLLSRGGSVLLAFVIIYTVLHLLSWALIRYRLPVDAVLLLYAGAGAAAILSRIERFRYLLPARILGFILR